MYDIIVLALETRQIEELVLTGSGVDENAEQGAEVEVRRERLKSAEQNLWGAECVIGKDKKGITMLY